MNFNLDTIVFQILLNMHQDYAAMALLLFTALPRWCVAAGLLSYVSNNERKTPFKREDYIDKSKILELLGW